MPGLLVQIFWKCEVCERGEDGCSFHERSERISSHKLSSRISELSGVKLMGTGYTGDKWYIQVRPSPTFEETRQSVQRVLDCLYDLGVKDPVPVYGISRVLGPTQTWGESDFLQTTIRWLQGELREATRMLKSAQRTNPNDRHKRRRLKMEEVLAEVEQFFT